MTKQLTQSIPNAATAYKTMKAAPKTYKMPLSFKKLKYLCGNHRKRCPPTKKVAQ